MLSEAILQIDRQIAAALVAIALDPFADVESNLRLEDVSNDVIEEDGRDA